MIQVCRRCGLVEPDGRTPDGTHLYMGECIESLRARISETQKKNTELNRRAQKAESAARATAEENRRKGQSFGRGLANWAASDADRRLAEEKKGREHDREQFRNGVEAWQKRIADVEKLVEQLQVQMAGCSTAALGFASGPNECKRGDYGWSAAFEDVKNLREKYAEVEKRVQAAQEAIAKRLRNCPGNFHEENPDGCKGSCQSSGCKTLRGIRDALKE